MDSLRYVAHSPYPDGTWRGIEKCAHDDWGALCAWETVEEVDAWIASCCPGNPDRWVPVAIHLYYPNVRGSLTEDPLAEEQHELAAIRCEPAAQAGLGAEWVLAPRDRLPGYQRPIVPGTNPGYPGWRGGLYLRWAGTFWMVSDYDVPEQFFCPGEDLSSADDRLVDAVRVAETYCRRVVAMVSDR